VQAPGRVGQPIEDLACEAHVKSLKILRACSANVNATARLRLRRSAVETMTPSDEIAIDAAT